MPLPRRAARWAAAWALLWLAMSTLGFTLHYLTWIAPAALPPGRVMHLPSGVGSLANAFTVAAAPGWIVCTLHYGRLLSHDVAVAAVAQGLAWAFWLSLLMIAIVAWRVASGRWRLGPAAVAASAPSSRHPGDPSAPAAAPPTAYSRRMFLVDAAFGSGAVVTSAALVRGIAHDPWALEVVRHRVVVPALPAALHGLRLVQLGDTHLGPRVPTAHIDAAVRLALSLRPDLFLLVGDYVHNGPRQIEPAAAALAPLADSGIPVVGVLGNHDWFAGGPAVSAALTRAGVRMIDNARTFYDARDRALVAQPRPDEVPAALDRGTLCLAGVGDLLEHTVDLAAALDGVPDALPRLLLSHNPDVAEDPGLSRPDGRRAGSADAGRRVDLMLSGHTHGGQVRLPLLGTPIVPSRYGSRYASGLVRGPACPVSITKGVGMSLIPIRLRVPPDVVEITLARA